MKYYVRIKNFISLVNLSSEHSSKKETLKSQSVTDTWNINVTNFSCSTWNSELPTIQMPFFIISCSVNIKCPCHFLKSFLLSLPPCFSLFLVIFQEAQRNNIWSEDLTCNLREIYIYIYFLGLTANIDKIKSRPSLSYPQNT